MRTVMSIDTYYKFEELPEDIQEQVIEGNRFINTEHDWWDYTLDYWKELLQTAGFELGNIYFSLAYCQGDYCSLEKPRWSYSKDIKSLEKEFGETGAKVRRIMQPIIDITRRYFYGVKYVASGSSSDHYGLGDIDTYIRGEYDYDDKAECSEFKEVIRSIESEIYYALRDECDYLCSDEQVKETLINNEYEFTEDGGLV